MTLNIARAKQIIEARMLKPDTAAIVEQSVALKLLGPNIIARDEDVRPMTYPQHGYLSPMAATEAFAEELQQGLDKLASNLSIKAPTARKYSPLFTSPTMFKEVWRARQVVDELGIPYGFYSEYAVLCWHELGHRRMPRPSRLTTPEIAAYVMECWADAAFRWRYPLFTGWDDRFKAANYTGDPTQQRALDLIDQRINDADALGQDSAAALWPFIGHAISSKEAERRYGADSVNEAMEAYTDELAESAAMLASIMPGPTSTANDLAQR